MASWRLRDPVSRFTEWLTSEGFWSAEQERKLRAAVRSEAVQALDEAGRTEKHSAQELFSDGAARWWVVLRCRCTCACNHGLLTCYGARAVYSVMPTHLREQQAEVNAFVARHPDVLPAGVAL